jgi:hypothetical protein
VHLDAPNQHAAVHRLDLHHATRAATPVRLANVDEVAATKAMRRLSAACCCHRRRSACRR